MIAKKRKGITRLLSININGLRSNHSKKIIQLTQYYIQNRIDIIMIIEPNIKWITKSYNIMKNKLRGFGHSLELIVVDSKVYTMTERDWLQGGTMAIITGNILTLI